MLGGIGGRRRRDDGGWDGWMASPTWWTWVLVNSGRWWWTGRPGVLQFLELQRVGHNWATELNWTCCFIVWYQVYLLTDVTSIWHPLLVQSCFTHIKNLLRWIWLSSIISWSISGNSWVATVFAVNTYFYIVKIGCKPELRIQPWLVLKMCPLILRHVSSSHLHKSF